MGAGWLAIGLLMLFIAAAVSDYRHRGPSPRAIA
jgi:hypothetical protein